MSEIVLSSNLLSAEITTDGAWLTRFRVNGEDILFPRTTFTLPNGVTKLRGGSHVCFPNFGPGGASGLAQHGFARDSEWEIIESSPDAVELALKNPEGEYAEVVVGLQYHLGESGLYMALILKNRGSSAVPVAPAFHPYFATQDTESEVDGRLFTHAALNEAVFLDANHSQLKTNGRVISLEQENMPQWVLWTDGLGDYVCLEPSAVGNGFVEGTALQLAPDQTWQGSLHIGLPINV